MMLTTKTSAEANHELDEQAFELAYQAIRWSPLWPHLENEQWDTLAERLKGQVRVYLDGLIDEELTRIEEQRNAKEETKSR